MLRDVSEVVGICEDEHTLACCEVAEATMVQVTPSQVLCCGLHALHDECEPPPQQLSRPPKDGTLDRESTACMQSRPVPNLDATLIMTVQPGGENLHSRWPTRCIEF